MILEVCCQDIESVCAAKEGGADRVELCSQLDLDGLTPSAKLIESAVATGIPVNVLIRCRDGNFVYNKDEINVMTKSIKTACELGANGIVIGLLKDNGDIDVDSCRKMLEVVHSFDTSQHRITTTFHRAFDVCKAPFIAAQQITDLGFDRILTSGQKPTAIEGIDTLRLLVNLKCISIMAGSGVSPMNAEEIVRKSGVTELHGTLRSVINGQKRTTVENVRSVRQIIDAIY